MAVLHDIPVLVVCATSLHVLLSFCTVLYLLFIITHPAFCTHSLDCRRNLTMSGSQDNLSKPINITIADGIQILAPSKITAPSTTSATELTVRYPT